MLCNTYSSGQTDAGSSQKHFLHMQLSRTSTVSFEIDPNFPQKRFSFALYQSFTT